MTDSQQGIVYCLENPGMRDLVKIGKTIDLGKRMRDLDTTGVPYPFVCVFAIEVDNMDEAEQLLHDAFAQHRVRPRREFFEIAPEPVVAAMRLTGGRDVTPAEDIVDSDEERAALDRARRKRTAFNFNMADIPVGAELIFHASGMPPLPEPITATVASHNKIVFDGEETSLSAAATALLSSHGLIAGTYTVAGTLYWHFEGESLDTRRRRLEAAAGD